MFSMLPRLAERNWMTLSFPSTLYLVPVLDLLLDHVPHVWKPEVRLGLQEALVNAAKHGNQLDPDKTIQVYFSASSERCEWVICDQGCGFTPPCSYCEVYDEDICDEQECGRGLFILHQIFDQVQWNSQGTELRLSKQLREGRRKPIFS
ncbi:MAG: ATP-binding protein [Alkalinema sp. CACIAM 70d]|nr:MAG: ATP-binding protein [Alkalinema sp. CACIAM 70d]